MIKQLFISACIIFSLNCYASGMTKTEDQKIKQGVTVATNNLIKCWNDGDLDCFMDAYARDKNTLYISGTDFLYGWEAFYDHYKKKYGSDKQGMGHLEIKLTEIRPLDSTHAFTYGRWSVKKDDKEFSGVTSMIFIKIGSRWQIMVDHSNS